MPKTQRLPLPRRLYHINNHSSTGFLVHLIRLTYLVRPKAHDPLQYERSQLTSRVSPPYQPVCSALLCSKTRCSLTTSLISPCPCTSQSILIGPPRVEATGSCPLCVGVSFHIVSGYAVWANISATFGRFALDLLLAFRMYSAPINCINCIKLQLCLTC